MDSPTPIKNENIKKISSLLLNFNLKYQNYIFEFKGSRMVCKRTSSWSHTAKLPVKPTTLA